MTNGLVIVKNSGQLKEAAKKQEELARQAEELAKGNQYSLSSDLASKIKSAWYTNRRHKEEVLHRLFNCLRARKGEYSAGELQRITEAGGADAVYIKLTGAKCRSANAWLADLLLPTEGDYPFAIQPTPIPTLPPDKVARAEQEAAQSAMALQMGGVTGMPVDISPEEMYNYIDKVKQNVTDQLNILAKKASERAETKIKDEMAEGEWDRAIREFLEDFVTYPAAFLKGPYFQNKKVLTWNKGIANVTVETKMQWRRVSPFDIYPAPYSATLQRGNLIERIRFTHDQVYSLIGLEGYNEAEIRAVLDEYQGKALINWIWEDWERNQLEGSSTYFQQDVETLDALHFWGSMQGKVLKQWGVKDLPDEDGYYEIDAILIGNHVIRCVINDHPLGERPYHFAPWDAIPGAIWGVALPEQMEEHQKIINAAARWLCNNMALAAGFQAEIQVDRLAGGEDITGIQPNKIWQTKSAQLSGDNRPAVNFFQPDDRAAALMAVMNTFEAKADDVTNVPRYASGSTADGASNNASALSMLMASAAKGIRRALAAIDLNVIKPTVKQTFVWLMLNDPDPDIQGDVDVVATGSTAQLIKEQATIRAQSFLREAAPFLGPNSLDALVQEVAELQGIDIKEELIKDALLKEQMQLAAQQQALASQVPGGPAPTIQGAAQEGPGVEQSLNQASR